MHLAAVVGEDLPLGLSTERRCSLNVIGDDNHNVDNKTYDKNENDSE